MSGLACFTTLPEELHILILSFLDHPRHLLTVSAVNGHFHRLVGDDILWHALFLQYNHKRTPYEEQSSIPFKELFKQRFVLGTLTGTRTH
jgi:F-box-like